MRRLCGLALAAALAGFAVPPAMAADPTPVGFVATFTGAGSALGREVMDGFGMGMGHLTDRFGGIEIELLPVDDRMDPEHARAAVEQMVADGVRLFVAASSQPAVNAAVAAAALGPRAFVLAATPLPPELAGRECNPGLFSLVPTARAEHAALAQHFDAVGDRRIWVVAFDSDAGRQAVETFRTLHRGEIAGVTWARPGQMSFAPSFAEIDRAAGGLDGLYMLLTGGMGVNFMRQFAARGLDAKVPVFAPGSFLDQPQIAAIGPAAVGAQAAAPWVEDLEVPVGQRIAADFEARHGRPPSAQAMLAYDAAMLLEFAFRTSAQDTATRDRTEAFRTALRRAEFHSVRGPFRFANNHFPLENWYLVEVTRTEKGRIGLQMRQQLVKDRRDPLAAECAMRWDVQPPAPPPQRRR